MQGQQLTLPFSPEEFEIYFKENAPSLEEFKTYLKENTASFEELTFRSAQAVEDAFANSRFASLLEFEGTPSSALKARLD